MRHVLLIAALLFGCAPDDAEPAPDCSQVPELCPEPPARLAQRDAGSEKHGTYGPATVHTVAATPTTALEVDNCQSWSYLPCWRRYYPPVEYGQYFAAPCPAGRVCTLRSLSWMFGWDGLDQWTQLPWHTVQICRPGWCVDISNTHSSFGWSRRYGETWSGLEGYQWTGTAELSIWFQLRSPLPTLYNPRTSVSFSYLDGV